MEIRNIKFARGFAFASVIELGSNYTCLDIATKGELKKIAHTEFGDQSTMTTYGLPTPSKLYFNGEDWKNGIAIDYMTHRPTVMFVKEEFVGFIWKTINGTDDLYYEYGGEVYKGTYANGGEYRDSLTKTVFVLI